MEFFVPGVPAPGGSKKAFAHAVTGRIMVMDTCKRNRSWRDTVASFALEAMAGVDPFDGPLAVEFIFFMPRPRSHYRTGRHRGAIKPSAPIVHSKKPDLTKLIRSTEDACTGIVWGDDAIIVEQMASKIYGCHPGVRINVTAIRDGTADEVPRN